MNRPLLSGADRVPARSTPASLARSSPEHTVTPADYQRIANQYGAARLYHHAAAWSQLAACLAICGPSAALTEAEEHAQAGRLVDAFDAISRAAKTPTVVGGDQ